MCNNGFFGFGGNNSYIWWIIILLLIFAGCNNSRGCICGDSCSCNNCLGSGACC